MNMNTRVKDIKMLLGQWKEDTSRIKEKLELKSMEEDRKRGRNKAERTAGTKPQKPDSATIFGGTSSLQKIWVVC